MGKGFEKRPQATAVVEEASSPLFEVTACLHGYPDMNAEISGTVCSGRGRACDDISASMQELGSLTGLALFPGSLNVLLNREVSFNACHARSFDNGKRYLWEAAVGMHKVWLYRWIGAPFHIVEILSENKLRDALGLVDGDKIIISVWKGSMEKIPMNRRLVSFLLWGLGRRHLYYHGPYADSHKMKAMRMRLRDGQR
ncbi:hypothetical protein ACM26W_15835 [Halomonas sp. HK25]|uniref:hypothetical protein n=1 Tax=Halomonas sp. HK25 TaxID=3394321 RepID=UPI0039FC2052